MPTDLQRLMKSKDLIINSISSRGPSLPVQVARQANLSLLFASAYLSELYNERKLRMSNMKVGSSPLYFINGQESQLENFIQYLNHKEREAFNRLKSEKILEDEKMEPAIRVALRSIKDFAIPVRIKVDEESKLFWKYYLLDDDELKNVAQDILSPKKRIEKKQQEKEDDKNKQSTLEEEGIEKIKDNIIELEKKAEELRQQSQQAVIEKPKKEKKKTQEESKFIKETKAHLTNREIEILNIIDEKKNQLLAKVRIDMLFGKQEFYLIAKDKKKISEDDLIISLQKAQEEKMPALILSPGEIDKKAIDYANNYRNLIKFEKLKL